MTGTCNSLGAELAVFQNEAPQYFLTAANAPEIRRQALFSWYEHLSTIWQLQMIAMDRRLLTCKGNGSTLGKEFDSRIGKVFERGQCRMEIRTW
jgi:hypothetical protein